MISGGTLTNIRRHGHFLQNKVHFLLTGETSDTPSAAVHSPRDVVTERVELSHRYSGDEGCLVSLECLQTQDHWRESCCHELQRNSSSLPEEAGRSHFTKLLSVDVRGGRIGRSIHGVHHSEIHSIKKEHSGRPIKSSKGRILES